MDKIQDHILIDTPSDAHASSAQNVYSAKKSLVMHCLGPSMVNCPLLIGGTCTKAKVAKCILLDFKTPQSYNLIRAYASSYLHKPLILWDSERLLPETINIVVNQLLQHNVTHKAHACQLLNDKEWVKFAPATTDDVVDIVNMYNTSSGISRYRRFFTASFVSTEQVRTSLNSNFTYLAKLSGITIACAQLAVTGSVGDVAVFVHDKYQSNRLGSILFHLIVSIAIQRNLQRLRASVLIDNIPMRHIIEKSSLVISDKHVSENVVEYTMLVRAQN